MRFSYAESMTDPTYYVPLAKAVEEAGYDSMVIPDSICYPETSDTKYPFNLDGTREFLDGKPFLEPFSLIPVLGAVTERIRFNTFVLKLPIRHPVLVAKQATSTAVLTGGRLGLGVGTSPWPEDYEVCGVPWERRGRRLDEAIDIIRGLSGGEYFEFHGQIYDVPSIKMCPAAPEPIPILIGGHGDAALRRAARTGDGWMHAGGDPALLGEMLDRLRALRREYGTEDRRVRSARRLARGLHAGRGASPGGPGRDRRDRGLPVALRRRARHRAPRRQAGRAQGLRGLGHSRLSTNIHPSAPDHRAAEHHQRRVQRRSIDDDQ